jgi:5-methylcytosine-specific restriction endonuclease McrA
MQHVLVLNASYEPLRLVTVRRAVILLLQEKAELVEAIERQLRAGSYACDTPLVIRLIRYVAIPRRMRLPFSRRGVIMRDRETCQYCGDQPGRAQLTLDHVVPRSQGGRSEWENVVSACYVCNHRKGGRTPNQAGMALISAPHQPHYAAFVLLGELERHHVWSKYAFG